MTIWNKLLYKRLKCFLGKRIIFIYLGNEVMIKQLDQQIIQKHLVEILNYT